MRSQEITVALEPDADGIVHLPFPPEVQTGGVMIASLTWPYGHGYLTWMKTIAAGKFKDVCLKALDDVAKTRTPLVITKRGTPIAKLVPYTRASSPKSLAGSILKETGDPFSTEENWDADAS